jgi:hypothetical protein
MWRRVSLVRTDVSEERLASIIRVKRIGEIGTTLAVTGHYCSADSSRQVKWRICAGNQGHGHRKFVIVFARTLLCSLSWARSIQSVPPHPVYWYFLLVSFFLNFPEKSCLYLKNAVFWDVTPCGSCKNRRFRGSYRLHMTRIGELRTALAVTSNRSTQQRNTFSETSVRTKSFSFISQKMTFFIVTAVKSSTLTYLHFFSSHPCYVPCPSHLPSRDHTNCTWRRVQIMKLLIMQLSPPSRHYISPLSKCS